MIPFTRREDGIHVTISSGEQSVLADLTAQLEQILGDDVWGDPVAARLFPAAYPDDREASAEFRRYTFRDQLDAKTENVRTVREWLTGARTGALDARSEEAWLRCLTDLRLTIAQRLGITDDEATPDPADDSDGFGLRDVYDWLGYVQEHLVLTLSGDL